MKFIKKIFLITAICFIISAFSFKQNYLLSPTSAIISHHIIGISQSVIAYDQPGFSFESTSDSFYNLIFCQDPTLNKKVFDFALKGYINILKKGILIKKDTLTVIDYSKSSNVKRLWVIDLKNQKVLFHELVAHGRNSGNEFAKSFSNISNSFKSSLGFYITGEIYDGKHEKSIKLIGLESKFNSNAFERGIVMHGASYVSESFINENQRLGRSQGCPAVSENVIENISSVISQGTCLFAYYPNKTYLKGSKLLKS